MKIILVGKLAVSILLLCGLTSPVEAQTSKTCQFSSGPRAGKSQYFPAAAAIAIASPCWDGISSFGSVVADGADGTSITATSSRTCQFISGPKAGQTQHFADATPVAIGSPCWDGLSSYGSAVTDSGTVSIGRTSRTSKTCRFTTGPKAGQTQFFPGATPVAIGSPCWDGISSHGSAVANIVNPVADSGSTLAATSTTCQFNAGPLAGQIKDFAGYQPAPLGWPCFDGMGSAGLVVAQQTPSAPAQKSQTCLYQTGPATGRAQFFPNFPAAVTGTPCWDGGQNFGIVIADVSNNTFQNSWTPGQSPPAAGPIPSTPNVPIQPSAPGAPTPYQVGQKCLMATGAAIPATAACFAQNMPRNAFEQCAQAPVNCFGRMSPLTIQAEVLKKGAEILGVDLSGVARTADKIWGGLTDLL